MTNDPPGQCRANSSGKVRDSRVSKADWSSVVQKEKHVAAVQLKVEHKNCT